MDTQLNELPTLPVLARGVPGCLNSAFLGLFVGARQLVRQDGWQAAIFGGRNRPSLLMVVHQLASASEVTSS